MKRLVALLSLTLAVATLADGQIAGDRVVLPVRDPTGPPMVKALVAYGAIHVKAHDGREVIVETPSTPTQERPEIIDGLRRIDPPARRLEIGKRNNVITIRA
jgi:hypothetical protein